MERRSHRSKVGFIKGYDLTLFFMENKKEALLDKFCYLHIVVRFFKIAPKCLVKFYQHALNEKKNDLPK